MSFSRKSGIANGPNAEDAVRHDLGERLGQYMHSNEYHTILPESLLQIFRRNTIWIVWRWPERDWKVTERDVEKVLQAYQSLTNDQTTETHLYMTADIKLDKEYPCNSECEHKISRIFFSVC